MTQQPLPNTDLPRSASTIEEVEELARQAHQDAEHVAQLPADTMRPHIAITNGTLYLLLGRLDGRFEQMMTALKQTHEQLDSVSKELREAETRIRALEKFRYLVMGAAAMIGALVSEVVVLANMFWGS